MIAAKMILFLFFFRNMYVKTKKTVLIDPIKLDSHLK